MLQAERTGEEVCEGPTPPAIALGGMLCVCVFVREKEIEETKETKGKREHVGPTSPLCAQKETKDKEGL